MQWVKSSGLWIVSVFLLCHFRFLLSLPPSESQNGYGHSWWHFQECRCPAEEGMVSSNGTKQTAISSTGQACPARGTGLPLRSETCPWLGKGHFLWIKEDRELMENYFGSEHFMVPCAGLPLRAGKKCPHDSEICCTRLSFALSVLC